MLNIEITMISELSDIELDAVAAGHRHSSGQSAYGNFALQIATNGQLNVAVASDGAGQGGNQSNSNNAGNIST